MQKDWSVFDGFVRPRRTLIPSWAEVDAWADAVEKQLRPRREAVNKLRRSWSSSLSELGGDPTERNWASFRPLRRQREEDWSDWLAQLLEDSSTGHFASLLFATVTEEERRTGLALPHVEREVPCGSARADLFVTWNSGRGTHIEVKVGDPNLAKTSDTADALERLVRPDLSHYILLLTNQLDAWEAACIRIPCMRARVQVRTWLDVAIALRLSIRRNDESLVWRVWAHAFCGAIEQDLLGLRFHESNDGWALTLTPSELSLAETLFASEEI